jgi:hypothetical protein
MLPVFYFIQLNFLDEQAIVEEFFTGHIVFSYS